MMGRYITYNSRPSQRPVTDHVHVAIVGFEAGLFGAFGVIIARMLASRFEKEIRKHLHKFRRAPNEESVDQSTTATTTQQKIGEAITMDAYVMT